MTFCRLLLIFSLFSAQAFAGSALQQIEQDPPQQFSALYIVPNELDFHAFKSINRGRNGALIGVGTFRILAAASYGNFSDVIFADIDHRIVEFNRLQIEALARAENIEDFFAKLSDHVIEGSQRDPNVDQVRLRIPWYIKELRKLAATDASGSFLTNPSEFLRLRTLAREGHMLSLSASLSGDVGFASLARALRAAKVKVSVVDVSNAPDYISQERYKDSTPWDAFERNLRLLPLAPNAVVNFTTDWRKGNLGFQKWGYTTVKATWYIENMETWSNYRVFLDRVIDVRDCRAIFH